ncbi:hypothetical protein ABZ934_30380 [Streptomyces sp. NPDC046557]|uniref:hypothetical protein n=1 Tax=Streptomyces sp. NPDC046557 TaxID=3155372 RepID=UPI0033D985BE
MSADHGGDEAGDVLAVYLRALRARMEGDHFALVVRAVQQTCARLADGYRALLEVPGEDGFAGDLQREYLSLLAVMITGSLDHRVVELPGPAGRRGWAVVRAEACSAQDACALPAERAGSGGERARIDAELDGIARACRPATPGEA